MTEEKKMPDVQETLNAPPDVDVAALAEAEVQPPPSAGFGAEGCCVREFWAVVERDGTLVRGRNVWRAAQLGQGIYEVIFTGDVSNGVYTATIGRPGITTEPAGMISVALRCCLSSPEENKGVWVDTHDIDGEFADRAFHLVVHTQ